MDKDARTAERDAAFDEWYRTHERECTTVEGDRIAWEAAWAACLAAAGERKADIDALILLLAEYGPVPHQAGCSGEFYLGLEKCGANRLNATLLSFWEGQDEH